MLSSVAGCWLTLKISTSFIIKCCLSKRPEELLNTSRLFIFWITMEIMYKRIRECRRLEIFFFILLLHVLHSRCSVFTHRRRCHQQEATLLFHFLLILEKFSFWWRCSTVLSCRRSCCTTRFCCWWLLNQRLRCSAPNNLLNVKIKIKKRLIRIWIGPLSNGVWSRRKKNQFSLPTTSFRSNMFASQSQNPCFATFQLVMLAARSLLRSSSSVWNSWLSTWMI